MIKLMAFGANFFTKSCCNPVGGNQRRKTIIRRIITKFKQSVVHAVMTCKLFNLSEHIRV